MTRDELRELLQKKREELVNLRFQLAVRKLKNHREIPQLKRSIARIQTILRKQENTKQ
jgi:large subunit ribosomal protein L29